MPSRVQTGISIFPTAQTMRLGVNEFAGRQLPGAEVTSYGLICSRLAHREAA